MQSVSSNANTLVVGLDVGTTSVKAAAVGEDGRVIFETRRAHATLTPRAGWAEQNGEDWAENAVDALRELVAALPQPEKVIAIGLTGQSPTVVPVAADGSPVGPGLLYRDNRAEVEARDLRESLGEALMHSRTGHVPEAFHIAPKLLWLRRHRPHQFQAARYFLQPRDVVLHALTGTIATDETHANSTLLYDLRNRYWSAELFSAMELDPAVFPQALPSGSIISEIKGSIARLTGLSAHCPVIIGGADSQCATYGSGVTEPGAVSEMAGTSSCINTATRFPLEDLRISQYSHVVPGRYTTELGINTTGRAVDWALSNLGFSALDELTSAAAEVHRELREGASGWSSPSDRAPLFMPYLGDGDRGDPHLRAGFLGLSDRHGRRELAYSVLEGIAFGVASTLEILRDAGVPTDELRVAGGITKVQVLGDIKADALGISVRHLPVDTALVGAALLGGSSVRGERDSFTATQSLLAASERHDPTSRGHERLAERFRWFRSLLDSPALRTPGTPSEQSRAAT